MPVERRNPLPAGVYWQDIFEPQLPGFLRWLQAAQQGKSVAVLRAERDKAAGRDWVLFRVLSPVHWEGPGFPTVATSEDMTSADTGDRPPPEQLPSVQDIIPSPTKTVNAVLIGAGVAIGLYLLLKKE